MILKSHGCFRRAIAGSPLLTGLDNLGAISPLKTQKGRGFLPGLLSLIQFLVPFYPVRRLSSASPRRIRQFHILNYSLLRFRYLTDLANTANTIGVNNDVSRIHRHSVPWSAVLPV